MKVENFIFFTTCGWCQIQCNKFNNEMNNIIQIQRG